MVGMVEDRDLVFGDLALGAVVHVIMVGPASDHFVVTVVVGVGFGNVQEGPHFGLDLEDGEIVGVRDLVVEAGLEVALVVALGEGVVPVVGPLWVAL